MDHEAYMRRDKFANEKQSTQEIQLFNKSPRPSSKRSGVKPEANNRDIETITSAMLQDVYKKCSEEVEDEYPEKTLSAPRQHLSNKRKPKKQSYRIEKFENTEERHRSVKSQKSEKSTPSVQRKSITR